MDDERYEEVLPNRRLVVDLQCRILKRMENVKDFMNVLNCWHKPGDDNMCGASWNAENPCECFSSKGEVQAPSVKSKRQLVRKEQRPWLLSRKERHGSRACIGHN